MIDISESEAQFLILCENIHLVSSTLSPIVDKQVTLKESQITFGIRSIVNGDRASSYLEVQLKYIISRSSEETPGYNLNFVIMGHFKSQEDLSPEEFGDFAKQYSLSILWPYAREYASDQLRRTGEKDFLLPIINPKAITEQLLENDLIEVEIVK
jgi:preprotein translocase subunit SecB